MENLISGEIDLYSNYNDIRNEYEYIRLKNLLKYDEKRNKIYDEHKELKELDMQNLSLNINIAKAKLDNVPFDDLEKELEKNITKRNSYLKEHNIRDDYREQEYDCDKCKDTGYVDGKKCSCYIKKEIELFDSISHFREYIKEDNFDNLDTTYYKQSNIKSGDVTYEQHMERVVDNLKLGVKNMDINPYNVILIGPTGTGKTFLARCAGALALESNHSVLYLNVNEYLNSIKPDYNGESYKIFAIDCDLLILDDLGTEYNTDFTRIELNYLIDKRLNDKKSTIITTNLVMDQLREKYLGPMYSRISHSYIGCYLAGEDLRRIKHVNI